MMNKTGVGALIVLLGAASAALCDTKIVAKYISDGQTTETKVFAKGDRLRYEYNEGLTLVRQCDQKRVIQIDDKGKTYVSLPTPQPDATKPQVKVTDTGEKKDMFGYKARHLKIVEAADGSKTETDGWYIDLKEASVCGQEDAGGVNRGFPLSYTMTTAGENGKPSTFTMSVTSLTAAPLEAALFEIPAGYTDSSLKAGDRKSSTKTPGVTRIGVVAMHNQSPGQNQSSVPYEHLLAQLQDAKFDVVPLADGSPQAIAQKAQDWQCDYILYNAVAAAEKPPAGGKIGGFLHKAPGVGRVTGGETVEARVDYKLVPAGGGSPVLASSATGKSGGNFNWKAAASLASNVMPMAMAAKMIGGGGMLNPSMMNALMSGHGTSGPAMGMDPMMSGMSMFLRSANPMLGGAGANSMMGAPGANGMPGMAGAAKQPGATETAIAAALDQEARAVIAQLKPAGK